MTTPDTESPSAAPPIAVPGVLAMYQAQLALANKLAAGAVRRMTVDCALAFYNARRGVAVITPYCAQIERELAYVSFAEIATLHDKGHALLYANDELARFRPEPSDAPSLFKDAHKVRSALMAKATVAVREGRLPAAVVDAIRRGRGPIDAAKDCIALATLFAENVELAARVNVSRDDIRAANDVGARLLDAVKPQRARAPRDHDELVTIDARDRLWTLFEQTWERHVWRAAAWVFGRDVDQRLPKLGAGRHVRKPATTTPPPTTTPSPTAAAPAK
jgi:hypothetical protein|nr:hypothetical protein [Kofleriaceae bacterium]